MEVIYFYYVYGGKGKKGEAQENNIEDEEVKG